MKIKHVLLAVAQSRSLHVVHEAYLCKSTVAHQLKSLTHTKRQNKFCSLTSVLNVRQLSQ